MLGVASSRRDARIPARTHILARICAMKQSKQSRTKSLATNIRTIPKNMPTNFQLKRLKLKLDIVEKPENRVHKLTDSNGALRAWWIRRALRALDLLPREASRGSRSSAHSARLIHALGTKQVLATLIQLSQSG